MDSFLQESRRVGSTDSQGQFEVAGEAALAKLAEYTVARPEQWVLKLVQAGVAGGATRIEFTQTAREVQARFWLADPPTPEDVRQAILSPQKPTSPFLSELAVGLRSVLARRRFRLLSSGGAGSLHWNGQTFEAGSEVPSREPFEVIVSYPGGWLTSNFKERAAESRAIQTEAAFCPIPLFWDSREVSVVDLSLRSLCTDHSTYSPYHLASGYLTDPQGEPEAVKSTRSKNPLCDRAPLLRWGRTSGRPLGSFSLFSSSSKMKAYIDEPFALLWTRHGVVLAAWEFKAPLGGFLQISGDHLRSDLGGLALFIEESDRQQARQGLSLLSPVGLEAIDWLAGFEAKTTYPEMILYTGLAIGMIALLALCAFAGGAPAGDLAPGTLNSNWGRDPAVLRERLQALIQLGAERPV